MIWIIALLNLVFVATDALRDRGVDRKWTWWEWHCAKWTSFFGQQILIILLAIKAGYIPLSTESIWYGVLYVILTSITWRLIYNQQS